MPINLAYFVQSTTTDNEKHISSGWKDVDLSDLGIRQSEEWKDHISIIFN